MKNVKYGLLAGEHKQGIGREERYPIMIRPELPPRPETAKGRAYPVCRRSAPDHPFALSQELLIGVSIGLLLAIVGTMGFAAFIL